VAGAVAVAVAAAQERCPGSPKGEEEGEITLSPHSPPPTTSPHLVTVLASKLESQLVLVGRVSIPPPQFSLALVCSVLQGMRVCIAFAAHQCTDDLLT
jgi:hypothetical protein